MRKLHETSCPVMSTGPRLDQRVCVDRLERLEFRLQCELESWYEKGDMYEEGMSIDEDIPIGATLTDLEICQAVCEQDQVLKFDDSDGDEYVEENPPTNAEMR
ncbi:hypothetical protein AVEN_249555-1 [Araneus ventricosus]|uniref:Uncharacterized protein n=1 Tax=Araneus ventricosus TaxID=182803 RepID=A0A4Y2R6M7_ARAVE|nr:hypothetical protein AVEN_249555-1 [Araneus ventricosus]